jgi:hypothetical protein
MPQPRTDAAIPPCPSWCDAPHPSDPYTHYSAVCEWANPATHEGDDWRIGIYLYRGDDCLFNDVGDTAVELYITGDGSMINADEEDRPELGGYLMPDQIRALATWLLAMADKADPFGTNGKPTLICDSATR